jgi:hypothetical protein
LTADVFNTAVLEPTLKWRAHQRASQRRRLPFRIPVCGCGCFRIEVSYLPDLTAYLHDLVPDAHLVPTKVGRVQGQA